MVIKVANSEGLIERLEMIDNALPKLSSIEDKIEFAIANFAVREKI